MTTPLVLRPYAPLADTPTTPATPRPPRRVLMPSVLACLLFASVLAACAGSYPDARTGPHGPDSASATSVRDAAMPYRVLRAKGGQEISLDTFYTELASADAVCVGEQHTDPHHHWAQLEVLDKLSAPRSGATMALGMEMFQRPFQGVLDDYAGKRIDKHDLHARSGWDQRWGHDFALYTPILDLAVARGLTLLALNITNELRHKISRQGMAALTQAERARLPELDLHDEEHRAWFESVMNDAGAAHGQHGQGHGPGHGRQHGREQLPPGHPPLPSGHPTPPTEPDHEPDLNAPDLPPDHPDLPPGHPDVAPDHPDLPPGHPDVAPDHPTPGHEPGSDMPPGHPDVTPGHPDVLPGHGSHMPAGHGKHPVNSVSRLYLAQVLWDETMAETAASWLGAGAQRRVIIIAGNGHCHESAIVRRMRRRGVERVVSVRPVVDDGDGDVAAELAQPMADYLFVMGGAR